MPLAHALHGKDTATAQYTAAAYSLAPKVEILTLPHGALPSSSDRDRSHHQGFIAALKIV